MVEFERAPSISDALPWPAWAGIAVVGVAVLFVGAYEPILGRFSSGPALELLVAIGGGAIFVVGASYAWEQYQIDHSSGPLGRQPKTIKERGREIAPSFEVYDPRDDAPRRR